MLLPLPNKGRLTVPRGCFHGVRTFTGLLHTHSELSFVPGTFVLCVLGDPEALGPQRHSCTL